MALPSLDSGLAVSIEQWGLRDNRHQNARNYGSIFPVIEALPGSGITKLWW